MTAQRWPLADSDSAPRAITIKKEGSFTVQRTLTPDGDASSLRPKKVSGLTSGYDTKARSTLHRLCK
jgi:hypothetical protein